MSAFAFLSNVASSRRYVLVGCLIVISFFLLSTHVYQIHNETLLFTPYHVSCTSFTTVQSATWPRKLWQSWKDDSDDPTDRTKGLGHEWRTINPELRYERITDANEDAYVLDNFPKDVSDLFTSLGNAVMKADYLRYLILLKEGGVWADIDVRARKPVKDWIPDKYKDKANVIIGIERDENRNKLWEGQPYSIQLAQFVMMAKPLHPIIEELVHLTEKNLRKLAAANHIDESASFTDIMGTTGPWTFTKIFMDYFTKVTGVEHNGDEMTHMDKPMLIGDVLVMPKISFGALAEVSDDHPDVLTKHFFIGSWLCKDSKMIEGSPVNPKVCEGT